MTTGANDAQVAHQLLVCCSPDARQAESRTTMSSTADTNQVDASVVLWNIIFGCLTISAESWCPFIIQGIRRVIVPLVAAQLAVSARTVHTDTVHPPESHTAACIAPDALHGSGTQNSSIGATPLRAAAGARRPTRSAAA